jgi:PAS domain S-box-containing protein
MVLEQLRSRKLKMEHRGSSHELVRKTDMDTGDPLAKHGLNLMGEVGLSALLAAIKDPVIVVDLNGTLIASNEAADMILEGSPVPGRPVWDFLPVGIVQEHAGAIAAVVASRRSLRCEPQIRGRWFDISVHPVFDPEGEVRAVTIHAHDVTAKKQIEASHRSSEGLLKAIVDRLPQWVCWKDKKGRLLGSNRAMSDALGIASASEIRGKTDADLMPPEHVDRVRQEDVLVMACRCLHQTEQTVELPGGPRVLRKTKVPLYAETGEVIGVLVMADDMSPT